MREEIARLLMDFGMEVSRAASYQDMSVVRDTYADKLMALQGEKPYAFDKAGNSKIEQPDPDSAREADERDIVEVQEEQEIIECLRSMARGDPIYTPHNHIRRKAAQWALDKLTECGVIPKPRTVMRIEFEGPVPSGKLWLEGDKGALVEVLKSTVEVPE